MAANLIITRDGSVRDADAMARYRAMNRAVAESFRERFGLRPLAVYGATETLEGDPAPAGMILLEFPEPMRPAAGTGATNTRRRCPTGRSADYTKTLVEGL